MGIWARAFGATLLAGVSLTSRGAAADRAYGVAGSRALETKTEPKSSAQIVKPTGAGAFPLIVASHGFSATGDNQIGWARHFASWGFVVAVPTFASPFSPNHQANAKVISDLVQELTGAAATTFSVAPGPFGLEGHSAGGLATTLAASSVAPSAVVLFDPVDANDAGKDAYANACTRFLGIFAVASSCNANAGWRAFASSTKSEVVGFDVVGSTHCDGENDPRALCATFCGGGANATRQMAYAHYATAFFLAHLRGDATAAAVLAATPMSADGEIANVLRATASCAPPGLPVDAGAPPAVDAGADAGADPSAPPPPGSSAPGGAAGAASDAAPAGDSGCGCRSSGAASGRALGIAAALGALAAGRRRRSARRR
ncbi:MAG: hypothetical protein KF850_07330 [Labilithrix sp.]|nr:hypothetical protein [Labilithrix sp.]